MKKNSYDPHHIVILVLIVSIFLSGCINESNSTPVDIEQITEMSFFDVHIILSVNETVEFTGKYDEIGPNRSSIDIFIFQENNTVKWNHLFLDQQLDVLPGEYVKINGKVLENDVYGYAQFIQVKNWTKEDIKINQDVIDNSKNSIKINSKILSEQSLVDIAKWNKESLKDYILDEGYFLNINISQSYIDFENQKIIISFKGARIPPFDDMLFRNVYIYSIFDIKNQHVEKLILTIQGDIQEL